MPGVRSCFCTAFGKAYGVWVCRRLAVVVMQGGPVGPGWFCVHAGVCEWVQLHERRTLPVCLGVCRL